MVVVFRFHGGVLENLQLVEFDEQGVQLIEQLYVREPLFGSFSGQAENQVRTGGNLSRMEFRERLQRTFHGVSSVDMRKRLIVKAFHT